MAEIQKTPNITADGSISDNTSDGELGPTPLPAGKRKWRDANGTLIRDSESRQIMVRIP